MTPITERPPYRRHPRLDRLVALAAPLSEDAPPRRRMLGRLLAWIRRTFA